jgi:hypothetical protein
MIPWDRDQRSDVPTGIDRVQPRAVPVDPAGIVIDPAEVERSIDELADLLEVQR